MRHSLKTLWIGLLLPTVASASIEDAVAAYRRAVTLNPQLVHTIQNPSVRKRLEESFLAQARTARKAGRFPEAERNYLLAGNLAESYQLFWELGSTYCEMGNWSQAVVVLKKAIKKDPANPEALAKLAEAYERAGNLDLAARFFARAISMAPATLNQVQLSESLKAEVRKEMIERSKMLAQKSMPLDAASKLNLALEMGDSPDLRIQQGKLYHRAGDDEAAARALARAVDLDSSKVPEVPAKFRSLAARSLYAQGAREFQKKKLERARHLFDASIELEENGKTHYNLGNVYVHASQLDRAVAHYKKAIALDSKLDEARLNLAMVLLDQKLHSAAITTLKELVASNPRRTEGYDLLAQAYVDLGKSAKAIKIYQTAIEFDPTLAKDLAHEAIRKGAGLAFFEDARSAFEKRDFQVAEAKAKLAITLEPDAKAYYLIGNARFAADDPNQAVLAYKKALEVDKDHAPTWNNLGNAYLKLKDFGKAVHAFRQATRTKPDFAQAFNNLGIALKKAGRGKEAIEAYEKALEIDPNYAAAYFNLGNALQNGAL